MPARSLLLPLLAAALAAPLPPLAGAAPDWKPTVYAEKLAHAPRPLPDRVVLTWNGNPATTQAVTWRTDTSVKRGVAELSPATDAAKDLAPRTFAARTEPLASDLGDAHHHSVTFTGLTPATLYAYRVGDGANWSEWFHFRTAAAAMGTPAAMRPTVPSVAGKSPVSTHHRGMMNRK